MGDREPRVELVPWDYNSGEHTERMYLQRLACGWRSEEVQKWVELGKAGTKTLYWIESVPIADTTPTHWQQDRTPSNRSFTPIGHLALDLREEENRHLSLADDGIVWVAGLYISWPLQRYGFGREVMRLAERQAAQEPLNGKWVVLDTMPREQQMKPVFIEKVYLAQGKPAPTVPIQDWYERQGYEVFDKEVGGYEWSNPETGEREDIDYLFLRKKLA